LGSSLPPAQLARRDSALFGEVKRLFSIAPEVGKETEANVVTEVTGRGLCMTRRVRSVFSVCAIFSLMIGRAARPVTDDRTRSVIQGAYWTLIGRWHCGVRSVQQRIWSLFRCALLRPDQHVRSVTGPARPVAPSASGLRDQRVRSVFRKLAVARPARPVSVTGASGQYDQRVRSARFRLFEFLTASCVPLHYK
jgi:hypothetical protein